MAIVFTKIRSEFNADGETVYCSFAYDASYPTGGEPVTPADVPFTVGSRIDSIQLQNPVGFVSESRRTSDVAWNCLLFEEVDASGALAEVANASDHSSTVGHCTIHGR